MSFTQLSRRLGRDLEFELAQLFIHLGDDQLPEEAHTLAHFESLKSGMDASGKCATRDYTQHT